MTGNTAMDYATLDSIVAKYGDENIIGFVFDNGGRYLKPTGTKVKDLYMDSKKECLVFKEKDIKGVPYNVVHAVACIQAVITVDDIEESKNLDVRYALYN